MVRQKKLTGNVLTCDLTFPFLSQLYVSSKRGCINLKEVMEADHFKNHLNHGDNDDDDNDNDLGRVSHRIPSSSDQS